jgi:hypothetical protein
LWSGVYARMSFRIGFRRDSLTAIVACPTLVSWKNVQPPAHLITRLGETADRVACWSGQSRASDSAVESYWSSTSFTPARRYNVQFIPAVLSIRDTVPPSLDTLVVRW